MICVLVALAAAVVLVATRGSTVARPLPARDASLLLLGLTNFPRGSFAIFCLSNSTRMHIACISAAFAEASAGAWTSTPLTGRASRAVRDWLGVPEELKPSQAVSFLVPVPTNSGAWRLVFMCQEQTPITDAMTNIVRQLTDTNAARLQSRQFSGRSYFVSSPQISR